MRDRRAGAGATGGRAGPVDRLRAGRSRLLRDRGAEGRHRPLGLVAPRRGDGPHPRPRGGRGGAGPDGGLAPGGVGGAHRPAGSRARPARDATGLWFALRRPEPGRRAQRALRRFDPAGPAGGAGRPGGRLRGAVRAGLDGRAARRSPDRGAGPPHAGGHEPGTGRGRGRGPARPHRGHRREGGDQRGDGRLPAASTCRGSWPRSRRCATTSSTCMVSWPRPCRSAR